MKVTLDTNCFIDAFTPDSRAFSSMQIILKACKAGRIQITISRHSLCQIKSPLEAVKFAGTVEILPHYPIGRWCDQIASWNEVAGTWGDAEKNQGIQEELEKLANSGTDIRDRGACIDAINSGINSFVTSDYELVGSGPANRIKNRLGIRIISPIELAKELVP